MGLALFWPKEKKKQTVGERKGQERGGFWLPEVAFWPEGGERREVPGRGPAGTEAAWGLGGRSQGVRREGYQGAAALGLDSADSGKQALEEGRLNPLAAH